ncbi:MAG TPA: hydrogenase iron-sulfur subunit [Gammaproteobacteria bacterium]|nr:hydrogenase iron-sulfur subunit [Gammaproteobacteria bacterium]
MYTVSKRVNPVKRMYLLLEEWFTLSFGADWNPLYHLGTLTFFFFWVVLISGLYLFIFFDTSIAGAYASVEHMTHQQWYAGGVMRSLHRYASDAAVVTILLHMFREFALDRYRGFRWWSWLTGVPTLWFVITLGITGYWLVWDELGLYVAVLSSQLMDSLPVMSGSMARDFLAGQLTDRLFTLMGFLHLLGQPILLIFAVWLHVKRLSHVEVSAPRGLAVGSLLALLVLSLLAPATSHAPAELSKVPAVLHLDWFYLNVYPLLDQWPATRVWMLTTSVTLLLMLMPWLPPKKTGPAAEVHLDECNGCGQCAEDCPFDAISVQARSDDSRWENEVVVNPEQCAACGICVGSCHSSNPFRHAKKTLETGIDMPQFPIDEVRARTVAALDELSGDTRIMLFGCDNAADIDSLRSPDVAVLSLFCTGMIPPTLVEYAHRHGADGVFITGCRTGDCYFRLGNRWLDQRFAGRRKPALRQRAQRDRIRVYRAAETDTARLRRELAAFQRDMAALKQEASVPGTRGEAEIADA